MSSTNFASVFTNTTNNVDPRTGAIRVQEVRTQQAQMQHASVQSEKRSGISQSINRARGPLQAVVPNTQSNVEAVNNRSQRFVGPLVPRPAEDYTPVADEAGGVWGAIQRSPGLAMIIGGSLVMWLWIKTSYSE